MCCFAQPVIAVSDTTIFARLGDGDWQYLAYQMQFASKVINAMILPLPVALPATDDKTVEFISLKEYDSFFDDLDDGFPLKPVAPSPRGLLTYSVPEPAAAPLLEVHEVGDFVASFVPGVGDFDRLDPQFRIPKESWDKIPRYADYGFAVFQLKDLEGEPHPMAFRFRSRLAAGEYRQIFFPTVHIHDGEVHAREHFDHTLYLQAPEFDAACGEYQMATKLVADKKTGYVRSVSPAKAFCDIEASKGILTGNLLVHRLDMHGDLENTDVFAALDLSHAAENASARPLFGLPVPVGSFCAAGLAWLFDRRDRIARGERPRER